MRRALAAGIAAATGGALRGLVMEDEADNAHHEQAHEKFARLEQQFNVVGYIFIYPRDCNTDGVRVEEGMLLRDLLHGAKRRIVAILEDGVAAEKDGNLELTEEGRRTRYTQGFLNEASNVYASVDLNDVPDIVAREARFMAFEN